MALPLGWGGFALAAVPVFGFAAFLTFLTFAVLQDRYAEAHYAIPSAEWRRFEIAKAFKVDLPGSATPITSTPVSVALGGAQPSATGWVIARNGAYFYAGVVQYPMSPSLNPDILELVLGAIKQENPKRYVYGDEHLTAQGRTGRQFEFTRPYTTMQVYLDGQRLYLLATNCQIARDSRKFLGSFKIE